MTSRIIPEQLATLPWRTLLLVTAIGTFGLVVLYSAAGGSLGSALGSGVGPSSTGVSSVIAWGPPVRGRRCRGG